MIRKEAETEKPKNKARPGVIKPADIRVFDPYSTGFFIYVVFYLILPAFIAENIMPSPESIFLSVQI